MRIASCVRVFALCALPGLAIASKPAQDARETGGGKVVWAGVRSSRYGIRPFPSPEGWLKAMKTMAGYFEGSSPAAIWIVGELYRPKDVQLDFPGGEKPVPRVKFGDADLHEAFLTVLDEAGVKVFLQVEPAHADVETLIDLVLGRYRHHACVAGFGIDVEWLREADYPGRGSPVSDEEARTWEARVKSWNPGYRLFLKHWNPKWMPATYRGDIIFVDDSQIFEGREEMIREFTEGWAPAFYPNPVVFQIGYGSDKPWWSKLETPPRDLGEAIRAGVKQDMGIIWVDFTLRDVLPEED